MSHDVVLLIWSIIIADTWLFWASYWEPLRALAICATGLRVRVTRGVLPDRPTPIFLFFPAHFRPSRPFSCRRLPRSFLRSCFSRSAALRYDQVSRGWYFRPYSGHRVSASFTFPSRRAPKRKRKPLESLRLRYKCIAHRTGDGFIQPSRFFFFCTKVLSQNRNQFSNKNIEKLVVVRQ